MRYICVCLNDNTYSLLRRAFSLRNRRFSECTHTFIVNTRVGRFLIKSRPKDPGVLNQLTIDLIGYVGNTTITLSQNLTKISHKLWLLLYLFNLQLYYFYI